MHRRANTDHLAVLHAIWTAETRDARHDRYRQLVAAALPPEHQGELSHRARWLFRTLHAAELAGLDPAEVIRTAIISRDLTGSRDVAAVIDARIRQRVDPLLPQPQGPWASRVPRLTDPARQAYLADIAALMDDRTRRLGEYTAQSSPAWTITALGPVPADPVARQDWERKAASIAAYRETYGYHHPGDPIGPEPSHQSPDQRAAWHQAFTAFGPAAGPDVRAMPDGLLWLLRDTYAAATAWAPRHVGKELRLSRLGGFDAALGAIRADAEADAARKAGDDDRAVRHEHMAASYRAMRDHYQQQGQALAQAMADRREWEQATAHSRHLAITADAELRRRHRDRKVERLRSAEPALLNDTEREQAHPAPGQEIGQAQQELFRVLLQNRQALKVSTADPGRSGLDTLFSARRTLGQAAILRPPKPSIVPSARILRRAAEHDAASHVQRSRRRFGLRTAVRALASRVTARSIGTFGCAVGWVAVVRIWPCGHRQLSRHERRSVAPIGSRRAGGRWQRQPRGCLRRTANARSCAARRRTRQRVLSRRNSTTGQCPVSSATTGASASAALAPTTK